MSPGVSAEADEEGPASRLGKSGRPLTQSLDAWQGGSRKGGPTAGGRARAGILAGARVTPLAPRAAVFPSAARLTRS
jgi:hypothetical protein